ncbi:VRR-NUC domain-containing protein [uncultured Alistipes sp.]|uniref:VRR-NUC domain-containing protein n=2 Tax=uncultured Alistipes sp. TaxID=538949 RepID=UPI0026472638|nr:VRR-NUC domain-containing protein [uncultured Alistipes sp.]
MKYLVALGCTPENMKESSIEKYLVRRVTEAGGLAIKLPATFKAGLPDRLVLLPGGRAAFVELKAPGAKPRPLQERVHEILRGLGFRVEVADTYESIRTFIKSL